MNAIFINSYTNRKIPDIGYQKIKQSKHDDTIQESKINSARPAQAISFGGSAVSLGQKLSTSFIQSDKMNKLVYWVNDNEVAFTAIYSLIIAGIMKPALVLAQTGFEDKDGQIIAAKNFLQAFIGSFLSFTVGGKFIKRIYDSMSNNLKLLKVEDDKLKTIEPDNPRALKIAKDGLIKENSKFSDKWQNAKNLMANETGLLNKTKAFFKGIQKTSYKPTEEEIIEKSKSLIKNLNDNHLAILNKNSNYIKKLVKNIDDLEINPSSLRNNVKSGLRSQPIDAFESFWKNSTGTITTIAKAKISSILLPVVVGTFFTAKNIQKFQNKKDNSSSAIVKTMQSKETFAPVSQNLSFKGSLEGAIDTCTMGLEKLATTSFFEKCTGALSKLSKKPSARMADIESVGLTGYWVYNTLKSKKIDPDQKLGLNTHTVLVTVVSSLAAFILDGISDPLIKSAENSYSTKLKEETKGVVENIKQKPEITKEEITELVQNMAPKLYNQKGIIEKLADKNVLMSEDVLKSTIEDLSYSYSKKLAKCKSLLIFTMVVRFLVPVLTVKQSKVIKNFLIELGKKKKKPEQSEA